MAFDISQIDLSEFRTVGARRRAAVERVRRRVDPTGMTRPPRDPDEVEVEDAG